MRACFVRTLDASPYRQATQSEDFRLALALSYAKRHSLAVDHADHRFLNLESLEDLQIHALDLLSANFTFVIFFVLQPSCCLDYISRFISILRKQSRLSEMPMPVLGLSGDTNIGCDPLLAKGTVDFVHNGNEESLSIALKRLSTDARVSAVPGISLFSDGEIKKCNQTTSTTKPNADPPIPHFYSIEYPSFSAERYAPRLRATKNCYARCVFCHEAQQYSWGLHYHFPIAWLRETISQSVSNGACELHFHDSNFLPHTSRGDSWVEQFTRMMRDDFPSLQYSFWTRAEDLTPERISLLVEAKPEYVLVGVESFSDLRLRRLGKKTTAAENVGALRRLGRAGIEARVSLILFDFDVSFGEIENDLCVINDLCREFPNLITSPMFMWNILRPQPGTKFHGHYFKETSKGLKFRDQYVRGMANRLQPDTGNVEAFGDPRILILSEIFRYLQYEITAKWFSVSAIERATNSPVGTFLRDLPLRYIKPMLALLEDCSKLNDLNREAPHMPEHIVEKMLKIVSTDYEATLPRSLQFFEVSDTMPYIKRSVEMTVGGGS